MGNESSSILEECSIDDKAILTSNGWSLHHAQREHDRLSVFMGQGHLDSGKESGLTLLKQARNMNGERGLPRAGKKTGH